MAFHALTVWPNCRKARPAQSSQARKPPGRRFIKTSNGSRSLDEASLARARRLVGLKGHVTNIPIGAMPAGEHLTIVFTALALSREAQNRTGLAIRNLIRQLRPLRSATIAINGTEQTFPPAIPADKQAVLNAIRYPRARHSTE